MNVLADNYNNISHKYEVVVTDNELIINGKSYNEHELERLLSTATPQSNFQERSATLSIGAGAGAYAGTYLIPGVGQVVLLATGVVLIGGATIVATHWAAKTIKRYFSSEDNMTANDIISKRRKAGVRGVFPGEYLNKTYKQIKKEAKAGKKKARTAKKLLEDGRFKK
jgi:hypothetical protein